MTLAAAITSAHAADWRLYSQSGVKSRELDASSVQARGELVFFFYRERVPYAVPDDVARPLTGVVDCKARRSSDVRQGKYVLRDVLEGTQQSDQLDLACRLAAAGGDQTVGASSADAALAPSTPGCNYVRTGGMPVKWQESRLRVQGSVDKAPTPMMIDTGATTVTMPFKLANQIGLPVMLNYRGEAHGSGGVSRVSYVRVAELDIGGVRSTRIMMPVADDMSDLEVLVGTSFLFQQDMEIDSRRINFFRAAANCDNVSLGYWAKDVSFVPTQQESPDDLRAVVIVRVNGRSLRALVDTGSPLTFLNLDAARQLGIAPSASLPSYEIGGVGAHKMKVWPVDLDEFALGDEVIPHPKIAVAELWRNARADMTPTRAEQSLRNVPDMILGADFLKAHHLLFANSQNRLYFSYEGGPVFGAATRPAPSMPSTPTVPSPTVAR